MRSGAVAIMDVLGFKGIWQHYEAGGVLQVMKTFEKMVSAAGRLSDKVEGDVWDFGVRPTYRFRCMSDTLFIGCWLRGRACRGASRYVATGASLFLLCRLASRVLAVATGLGLPLRGCIAAGDFDVARNFVIGPAVDEAAEWADEADGAFVWLRPDALALYRRIVPARGVSRRHLVYPYEVPIKSSGRIRTGVINPRGDERRSTSKRDLTQLLRCFDENKPGVASKLRNTRRFFNHVLGPDRHVQKPSCAAD